MKSIKPEKMTIAQLVARFVEIGIAQSEAELSQDRARFSKLYDDMDMIDRELRARGPDARLALLKLYNHPNKQVRLKAAKRTLGVAPEAARHIIEKFARVPWPLYDLEARITLRNLDRGIFLPD